jgi:hypothetical protein
MGTNEPQLFQSVVSAEEGDIDERPTNLIPTEGLVIHFFRKVGQKFDAGYNTK